MTEFLKKHSTLAYLALGLLACAGGLAFRRDAGIWMMLPIYPLCVALSNFLPIKRLMRGVFLLLIPGVLNAVATDDRVELALIVGMALLTFVLTELAVCFLRKKRALQILAAILLLAGVLASNALLFGDPFSAFLAGQKLDAYIQTHYETQDGGLVFENIRFDRKSRLYLRSVYRKEQPSESGLILLSGGTVIDHFKWKLEDLQMQAPALELTAVLRKAFPKDSFTVRREGIRNYPAFGQKRSANDANDYGKDVQYSILLPGCTTYQKLEKTAQKYIDVLSFEGVPFGSVQFIGGAGVQYRISLRPDAKSGMYYDRMIPGLAAMRYPALQPFLEQYAVFDYLTAQAN